MNENDIIDNLRKVVKNSSAINLNDDVFFDSKKSLVASIDTYNEKIHFINFKYPNLVIKKAIRSAISDVISKGIDPKFILISFSGPKKTFTKKNIKLILNSIKQEQKKYNFSLIGGDTTLSIKVSFTICVFGYSKKIIKRNSCLYNDDIYVTGNIGDAAFGLDILRNKFKLSPKLKNYFLDRYFKPDLAFGFHKQLFKFANSSMDISDGLLVDLNKLSNNNSLGFMVDYNLIPISNNLKNIIKSKKINLNKYLFKGDDYQILFTAKKRYRNEIINISNKWNQKVTRIGIIINKSDNYLKINNKFKKIVNYQGYIHNFG